MFIPVTPLHRSHSSSFASPRFRCEAQTQTRIPPRYKSAPRSPEPATLQLADLIFTCCHHQHVRISVSLPAVEAKRHLKKAFDVPPFPGSQAYNPLRVLVLCVWHRCAAKGSLSTRSRLPHGFL